MWRSVRARIEGRRRRRAGDRARGGVVAPIGLIVAVAIVCIVVAVLTSAQRADEGSLNHERQLFLNAIVDQRERVLRELESVSASPRMLRSVQGPLDTDWIHNRLGLWLKTFFAHEFVFVADASDQFVYALLGNTSAEPRRFNGIRPELAPMIDHLRGRPVAGSLDSIRTAARNPVTAVERPRRIAKVLTIMNRPAVAAGVVLNAADPAAPALANSFIVLTLKFIDEVLLAEISARTELANLRYVQANQLAPDEKLIELNDSQGQLIARFSWTPKRPGAEIVANVLPFLAVALGAFVLLAAFVLHYIRRTAATIAAGEDQLRHLAMHDPLSDLPNRTYFGERLAAAMDEAGRDASLAAVLSIDLDHFKDINDTLGHHIGDGLIRSVAQRLVRTLRSGDLVARLGGDEFAVITTEVADLTALDEIAQRLIEALRAPYDVVGHTLVIGASIGIAVIDRRSGAAADIMRRADVALYRAKNEGRNRACIYDADMDADLRERKQLENDLRDAIASGGLSIAYQPIMNASGEKMAGVEALCRWHHRERGDVTPAQFIPIAERSELIIPLGEWVLRRACLEAKAWPGLTLAVNVSPLQFRRPDFAEMIERTIADTGFEPQRLELELTETTLLGNVDNAESAMRRLKAQGIKFALDDFGTGYSSLLYLRRFPFDRIKIDRSFVHSIETAADAASIVHAIVSLGRGLGMKVTAEGVETAEQQLFLRAAGVHSMQGYRFGKPAPASVIDERRSAQVDKAQAAPQAAAG